ncbi:DUF814 domain-containing protein, partial [Candidatus Pacearchaeota archaeon]|nr:DUF814 domain-containing protein [Candidatus Pacearchaeota archaeon]
MNNVKIKKKYEKFKWFFTSGGVLVVGGKSDSGNEVLLKEYKKPGYVVTHTSSPGSPFCIIVKDNPSKKDIEETCVFCSCFS